MPTTGGATAVRPTPPPAAHRSPTSRASSRRRSRPGSPDREAQPFERLLWVLAALVVVAVAVLATGLSDLGRGADRARALVAGGTSGTGEGAEAERVGLDGADVLGRGAGIARAPAGKPVAALVREVEDLAQYELLVLQSAPVDANASSHELQVAATHLLDLVAARTGPTTTTVLVGPVPPARPADPLVVLVDGLLRTLTQERRVPYVSPVDQGWTQEQPDLADRITGAIAATSGSAR